MCVDDMFIPTCIFQLKTLRKYDKKHSKNCFIPHLLLTFWALIVRGWLKNCYLLSSLSTKAHSWVTWSPTEPLPTPAWSSPGTEQPFRRSSLQRGASVLGSYCITLPARGFLLHPSTRGAHRHDITARRVARHASENWSTCYFFFFFLFLKMQRKTLNFEFWYNHQAQLHTLHCCSPLKESLVTLIARKVINFTNKLRVLRYFEDRCNGFRSKLLYFFVAN